MKARYLTFFSYIGTKFRSSEKVWLKEGRNYPDPESIQGMMEIALFKLKPKNYPELTLSSRTDGGVHAINATAHFDIDRGENNCYDGVYLTYNMNKFFLKNGISIYVRSCRRVNDSFNARYNAISRTYLYRLAVKKPHVKFDKSKGLATYIPVEEWKRCHFLRPEYFDIERFKEGAKYFIGCHDFTTFKKFVKSTQNKHNRREIIEINVKPGVPCVTSFSLSQESVFNYWDIELKGRGFVHNQIRRMIGALSSVASGKLEAKDIKLMLQIPSKNSWHHFIQTGPPDGLYLCNVEYKPEDLIYNKNKDVSVSVSKEDSDSE